MKYTFALLVVFTLLFPKSAFAFHCPIVADVRYQDVATICNLEDVFYNFVSVVGILIGFSFFGMLIYGGTRFLLSGGDPKAVQTAKGTITWAVIGLAFFALSYTILLIIRAFTGVDVTMFRIGLP